MKRLVILTAALATAAPVAGNAADYAWPVVRVIDGDTVAVDASADMPPELAEVRVRLRGLDAPEISSRAQCERERAGGKAAAAFVERKVAEAEIVEVRNPQWGKWGGRVVADVLIDGESLAVALVQSLHGRWCGGGARADWCHRTATGGDTRIVIGAFFGRSHKGMGRTLERSDMIAAFGGSR